MLTEEQVDKLIMRFDAWLQKKTGDEALTKPEKAMVKTFCAYIKHGDSNMALVPLDIPQEPDTLDTNEDKTEG